MAARKKNDSEKRFEELLAELEKVVHTLEREEPDLELALAQYQRGMELTRECRKRLDEAERKVMMLKKNPDGEVVTLPFSEGKGTES